jgi:hypothetical protein
MLENIKKCEIKLSNMLAFIQNRQYNDDFSSINVDINHFHPPNYLGINTEYLFAPQRIEEEESSLFDS